MSASNSDSVADRPLVATAGRPRVRADACEEEVLVLFNRCGPSLLRYVASFGLSVEETEDIVQEAFLLLFRHLRLDRPQVNLKAWLFQVAHNLALRQRRRMRQRPDSAACEESSLARHIDPSPGPEALMTQTQRRQRLQSILHALPERDRRCVFLRADGLRYREIATALGMSLGAVAKSLRRSIGRLMTVDQR